MKFSEYGMMILCDADEHARCTGWCARNDFTVRVLPNGETTLD